MRILHTSDWHLGKIFHEYPLLEDQRHVLNQIIQTLKSAEEEKNPFAALVVSGDIYDRAVPTAEATTLLNDFLVQAANLFPNLHIFMISGNHDSASRLSFAASFLEKHNIHLATGTKNFTKPVIVEQNGEKAAFYQLPFLQSGSIQKKIAKNSEENSDSDKIEKTEENSDFEPCRSQQSLFEEACVQIIENHKKNFEDLPAILNAHLFTLGGMKNASERSNIGTAEQVDANIFKDFAYGAFGHIHKFQVCDKNHRCYYPGSLLAYNFDDDAESGMLDVEIKSKDEIPSVKRIFFRPLHKIATLEGKFSDFINPQKNAETVKNNKDNFLQIILTDETLPTEPFARLKSIFPNLLVLSSKERAASKTNISLEQKEKAMKSNNPEEIFSQFLADLYGETEKPEESESKELLEQEKKLFLEESKSLSDE